MTRALPLALLAIALGLAGWLWTDPHRRHDLTATAGHLVDRLTDPINPPRPQPPPTTPPGAPYTLTLTADPATHYRHHTTPDPTGGLLHHAGLEHAPALTAAAHDLAAFYATHRRLAPGDALTFMLDAAGAPYWGVRQAIVVTPNEARGPVLTALTEQVDAPGPWHAGLATHTLQDGRVIHAALIARPALTLEPIPRHATTGEAIPITLRLAPDHTDPTLIVRAPDDTLRDHPLTPRGSHHTATLTPDTPGEWQLELLATGPSGPVPLTQLTLHIDERLPDRYAGTFPPPDDTDPPARLLALLTTDRAAHGLPPLTRDPALDALAAAHSADMRDHRYVGHHSPRTGDLGDRLRAARLHPLTAGENVALNQSLADAQAGLMRSLGHRKNILSPDFTHVGLAAARGPDGWYITQVFTRPAPTLAAPQDIDTAEAALLARINHARRDHDAPPLRLDPDLTALARAEARASAATPENLVDRARRARINARLAAWTITLQDPEGFTIPDGLLRADLHRLGLALHPLDGAPPTIQIALIARD